MTSATDNAASETPAHVPEAYMEPTPVTLTPEASVAPPAGADSMSTIHDLPTSIYQRDANVHGRQ